MGPGASPVDRLAIRAFLEVLLLIPSACLQVLLLSVSRLGPILHGARGLLLHLLILPARRLGLGQSAGRENARDRKHRLLASKV